MTGFVHLVGAGPGDPELLTLKAARLLAQADVILHDSLVDPRILDLRHDGALLVDAGKRCGKRSATQDWINATLVQHALAGAKVVRLKGGDPMLFGRADEELAVLEAHGIPYEVVPGVTAACAAAAALSLSLTKRNVSRALHLLTAHGADGELPAHDWVALARRGGTLAIYMGARRFAAAAAHLIEAGMQPGMAAIAIENASLPGERIFRGTVAALPGLLQRQRPDGPVLILIGAALTPRQMTAAKQKLEVAA